MGSARAFQILLKMKQAYCPDVVFIMETKINRILMESLRIKLGYSCKLVVESAGKRGGLGLFWSDSVDIQLLSFSSFHIDVQVVSCQGSPWRFTGFYGHPEVNRRHHGWMLLRRLHGMSNLPWLCAGDFNEILVQSEKLGGVLRPQWQMTGFRDALDDCDLQDIGFDGPCFTWCNRRAGSEMIQERLDRCVSNFQWSNLFPNAKVSHLEFWKSDHRPLLLELDGSLFSVGGRVLSRRRRFFFEACWIEHKECEEIVRNSWSSSSSVSSLRAVMTDSRKCAEALGRWNARNRKELSNNIRVLQEKLR